MTLAPHPDSFLKTVDGRTVSLKAHGCVWSGEYPENSLAAVEECYRERVARAEIDINMLLDSDFLVTHDAQLDGSTTGRGLVSQTTRLEAERLRFRHGPRVLDHRPPLLSEVVAKIRQQPFPTRLELDVKDIQPWPWRRVEELAGLVEPVKDRVIFGGCSDWNLRRLRQADPTVPLGFDPDFYLERARAGPVLLAEDLHRRLGQLVGLVPGARELHLRLSAFERALQDGSREVAQLVHEAGLLLDVWTLDAATPDWDNRLAGAVAAGVDMITTNTARALAASWRAARSSC
ncbi:MAG TPA: glycerophosphodiester phosphodiesterase family protein [Chloroflexota bacterium]|nr:glycerophosphodiester phosphodiesterase family protein [Chloroflexota bacterium]